MEINISDEIRREVLDGILNIYKISEDERVNFLKKLFDKPQKSVTLLLKEEPFPRFLLNEDYKLFCNQNLDTRTYYYGSIGKYLLFHLLF